MADVQIENGYCRVANEILDHIARCKLNGTHFRIVMVVWRFTYGFQRKEHELSISFIASATEIHKKQIDRELKELISRRIVTVVKEASFNQTRIVSFNKNYDEWILDDSELKRGEVAKKLPVSEEADQTGSELAPSPGSGLATQEIYLFKDNLKENIIYIPYKEIIEYLNSKAGTDFKHTTKATQKHISGRWNEGFTLDQFKSVIDKKCAEWINDPKWSQYLRPQTLFNSEKFESYLNQTIVLKGGQARASKPESPRQSTAAEYYANDAQAKTQANVQGAAASGGNPVGAQLDLNRFVRR